MMAADEQARSDQVRELMIEAARTQLAAVTAATKFWSGWVQAADRFAEGVSAELARMDAPDGAEGDLVGRLTDLSRQYLRDLTELPTASVNHFNRELEKIGRPRTRRTRAAKVKD
jgi:hypothetical protein